jgi:hypothetical protein
MKKLIAMTLMGLMFFGISEARKQQDLAGKVENATYSDGKYNFSMGIPSTWDFSIKKDKSPIRMTLSKKSYDIPIQFQHAPNYTTIPKIMVYVDTTNLSTEQFIDSLLSNKFNSKQKNALLNEFPVLYGDFILKRRIKIQVGDVVGGRISGQTKYTKEVQRQGSESDLADVVTDFYGGSVFFIKNGNNIIIFHLICEWRYFEVIDKDFAEILNGFKLGK